MKKVKSGKSFKYPFILLWILVTSIFMPAVRAEEFYEIEEDDPAFEMSDDSLLELDLNELMEIEVYAAASITEKDPMKIPASVTVITAEDIARTPARNILDLMEIYVPGALYLNHSTGPQPGIRGFIADRPYKFLVTLNGININLQAHYGARLELLNWDMNDIEKIEIIRGPGSVTYGPGAIGGVINIYTKTGATNDGISYGGTFWDKYDSIGNYLSYGKKTNDVELYSYLSVVHTTGTRPDLYGVGSSSFGYVGEPGGSNRPPATYMSDFFDEPEVKAHFDMRFNKNWRFWGRYSSSSSELVQGSAIKYNYDGGYKDFRETRYRYYQFALENDHVFSEEFSMKSKLAYSSKDTHNIEKFDTDYTIENDKNNLQNIGWMWSEDQLYTQLMLKFKPEENFKAAMGFEFSYDTIGPGWGRNADNGLMMGKGMISGTSSDMYGTGYRQLTSDSEYYYAVGNGWETYSHAILGELNFKPFDKTTTILSSRLDKHEYTDYMLSPRLAVIQELREKEYLKFIAQRSVRRNTAEELYMNHVNGEDNDPEELSTYELIYTGNPFGKVTCQASTFYNNADVIAYDFGQSRSSNVGSLQTWGLELEGRYDTDDFTFGMNHSFVKQLDWKLASGVDVSGISYSDYYRDAGDGVIITSQGNDLNNWANHATKLFTNINLLEDRVSMHTDLVTFWGFEGRKDGLDALTNGGSTSVVIDDVNDHNVYDLEMKANISLTFHLNKNADLSLFGQNIPVAGDNKRYSYSSGFKKSYPDKVSWIEEPAVFGLRFKATF